MSDPQTCLHPVHTRGSRHQWLLWIGHTFCYNTRLHTTVSATGILLNTMSDPRLFHKNWSPVKYFSHKSMLTNLPRPEEVFMIDVPVKNGGIHLQYVFPHLLCKHLIWPLMTALIWKSGKQRLHLSPRKIPGIQFTLDELLERMTIENVHEKIDFGSPVSKELL